MITWSRGLCPRPVKKASKEMTLKLKICRKNSHTVRIGKA